MNLKNILLICLLICSLNTIKAQQTSDSSIQRPPSKFKDKITFNMGGGLVFGTVTNISLLPQIGYKITPQWIAGVGANLQYFKNTLVNSNPILLYGGNAFTRYHISQNLFLQTEYQKIQYFDFWSDYLLAGGGYINPSGFYISAYYIFIQPNARSVYNVPYTIRVGYNFNL
jgi:hypothetical protein